MRRRSVACANRRSEERAREGESAREREREREGERESERKRASERERNARARDKARARVSSHFRRRTLALCLAQGICQRYTTFFFSPPEGSIRGLEARTYIM